MDHFAHSDDSPRADPPHDRWLMAEGPTKRSYLVHTQYPRFVAEIVERKSTNGVHDPIVGLDKDCALTNFNWDDPKPHGDQLDILIADATDAVLEDDAITVAILDAMLHSERDTPEPEDGFNGLNKNPHA